MRFPSSVQIVYAIIKLPRFYVDCHCGWLFAPSTHVKEIKWLQALPVDVLACTQTLLLLLRRKGKASCKLYRSFPSPQQQLTLQQSCQCSSLGEMAA